jgi:hypothetical protein
MVRLWGPIVSCSAFPIRQLDLKLVSGMAAEWGPIVSCSAFPIRQLHPKLVSVMDCRPGSPAVDTSRAPIGAAFGATCAAVLQSNKDNGIPYWGITRRHTCRSPWAASCNPRRTLPLPPPPRRRRPSCSPCTEWGRRTCARQCTSPLIGQGISRMKGAPTGQVENSTTLRFGQRMSFQGCKIIVQCSRGAQHDSVCQQRSSGAQHDSVCQQSSRVAQHESVCLSAVATETAPCAQAVLRSWRKQSPPTERAPTTALNNYNYNYNMPLNAPALRAPEHDALSGSQAVIVLGVLLSKVGLLDVDYAREGHLVRRGVCLSLRVHLMRTPPRPASHERTASGMACQGGGLSTSSCAPHPAPRIQHQEARQ